MRLFGRRREPASPARTSRRASPSRPRPGRSGPASPTTGRRSSSSPRTTLAAWPGVRSCSRSTSPVTGRQRSCPRCQDEHDRAKAQSGTGLGLREGEVRSSGSCGLSRPSGQPRRRRAGRGTRRPGRWPPAKKPMPGRRAGRTPGAIERRARGHRPWLGRGSRPFRLEIEGPRRPADALRATRRSRRGRAHTRRGSASRAASTATSTPTSSTATPITAPSTALPVRRATGRSCCGRAHTLASRRCKRGRSPTRSRTSSSKSVCGGGTRRRRLP